MAKTLYLMRHGQTLFNQRRKIQGWCDSPLTSDGQKQAQRAGDYFRGQGITFDHAYTSTSERAIDTLEIVTQGKMPYTRLKGIKEMSYGMFEGESEDLAAITPKDCETYYLPYGGESSNDVRDCMMKTLTDIMEKEDHHNVLAVSHGGACFNFLRGIQDPTEELQKGLPNCCIFVYEYEHHQFQLKEVIRDI